MEKKTKVLFVASECAPIAKVGGLGDVVGSLPKALIKMGCDVRIIIPRYKDINFRQFPFKKVAEKIKVRHHGFVDVYQGLLPESKVIVYLISNEEHFGEKGIYFERDAFVGSFKEIQRFLFFSQAVLETFPALNWYPRIIHCHDWHTAVTIMPLLVKIGLKDHFFNGALEKVRKKGLKTLFTIHNLANQGKCDAKEIFELLGLKGNEVESLKVRDGEGDFNILQQGILNADLLNTVSPAYAKEILTKQCGEGLEKTLLKRRKDLSGILNGIDTEEFSPKKDPDIKTNFSAENLAGKKENKLYLQKIMKLPKKGNVPLLAFVGRLVSQKGVDLICKAAPDLIKLGCQIVVLGVGSREYEREVCSLAKKYPDNFAAKTVFDPVLAKRIYAGADLFLMPSRFEPCGLGQMIAMRYGTIPIVRKTGGLSDTVKEEETGFLFEKYDSKVFFKKIEKALAFYRDKKKWNSLVKRAAKSDFSWKKSAKEYKKLYKKLIP